MCSMLSLFLFSHDHSNLNKDNAIGEIHMAMYAANGVSGMQTTLVGTVNLNWKANPEDTGVGNSYGQNDQTEVQIAIPMPPGFAHGPLWSVDPATGEPTRTCLRGIQFPFREYIMSSQCPFYDAGGDILQISVCITEPTPEGCLCYHSHYICNYRLSLCTHSMWKCTHTS